MRSSKPRKPHSMTSPGLLILGFGLSHCAPVPSSISNAPTNQAELQCDSANLQIDPSPGTSITPAITGTNVVPVTVNGSLCLSASDPNSALGPNAPCVSVTVCPPGASSNSAQHCQVISGLLLDTGSVGLRVFKSVLNADLLAQLTPVTVSGFPGVAAECVTYADGSADWGPIGRATVFMGGEPGVSSPIQLIDGFFGGTGANGYNICNSYAGGSATDNRLDRCPTNTPASAPVRGTGLGYNGILGVGLYAQDCGAGCANPNLNYNPGTYYSCSGDLNSASSCRAIPIAIPTPSQVQNLIASLPTDNNGIILTLPSPGPAGTTSANGYMIFGIETQSNNQTPSGSAGKALLVNGYMEVNAAFNGTTNGAFIDSGSTFLHFPPGSSTSNLVDCGTFNSWFSSFFCPTNNTNTLVSMALNLQTPSANTSSIATSITVGNPLYLFSSYNWVFSNVGLATNLIGFPNTTLDLGLPFYLGKKIYHGYQGKSSSLGSGPYWYF